MKYKLYIISLILLILFRFSGFSQNCFSEFSYSLDSSGLVLKLISESYSQQPQVSVESNEWLINSNMSFVGDTVYYNLYQGGYIQTEVYVCLTSRFSDSCQNTTCDSVYTNNIDPCANFFAHLNTDSVITGSCSAELVATPQAGTPPYDYLWSNGATQAVNPGLCEGNYFVTVEDANSCTAIASSYVTSYDTISLSLSGKVYAKSALLPQGVVVLYRFQNADYYAVDHHQISNGSFSFTNLDTANYLVQAIPYFNYCGNYYPLYYPTWSGNSEFYQNADIVYVDSTETLDIELNYNENIYYGDGMISGKIVYDSENYFDTDFYNSDWFIGLRNRNQAAAQNQIIMLFNDEAELIRFDVSDQNGLFRFNDLPYDNYSIHVELPGKSSEQINLFLDDNTDTVNNLLIHIRENDIVGIEKELFSKSQMIYPNPVKDLLYLELEKNVEYIIELFDLNGRSIFISSFESDSHVIDFSEYSIGVYILKISNGNNLTGIKKVIKQ